MAGLSEKTKWENEIYRIEENDPVHGGEDGITNKPTKQLANRTQYLKQKLGEAEQKLNPKKLTATTKNAADSTGHTHAIDLASTSTKGLVQLTNDTGLDSEVLALTAKAGKKLAGDIARVQQAANAKYTAQDATTTQKGIVQLNNTLSSTSQTQALTAAQGKALKDELDAMNIGGRNYLLNSSFTQNLTAWRDWGDCSRTFEAVNGRHYLRLKTDNREPFRGVQQSNISFKPNTEYVFSITAFSSRANAKLTVGLHQVPNNNPQIWNANIVLTDTPTRYWFKFRSVNDPAKTSFTLMIGGEQRKPFDIYIAEAKLEVGNRATDWSPAPEDSLFAAFNFTREGFVAKAGDTMSGSLIINHPAAIVRFQQAGNHIGYLGFPRENAEFLRFSSNKFNNYVELQGDKTYSQQPLYVGSNEVFHQGNLLPVKQMNLWAVIANSSVAYQDATPEQLPLGSLVGISNKAGLDGSSRNGWMMINKAWSDRSGAYAMNRIGIVGNRLYLQSALDYQRWGEVAEVVTDKNDILIKGTKTFDYQLRIKSAEPDAEKYARLGQNVYDTFLQNPYSLKYLQLKNNGKLQYDNKDIFVKGVQNPSWEDIENNPFTIDQPDRTVDVRSLTKDGIYAFGNAAPNLPSTYAYKVLNLAGGFSGWRHQLAFKAYSKEIYVSSQKSAGSEEWLPWERLLLHSDLNQAVQKRGDSMNTLTINAGHRINARHYGQGSYVSQYGKEAPFMVLQDGATEKDTFYPFLKGKVREANQFGAAFSFGYTTYSGSSGAISLTEDNGQRAWAWRFEHGGNFRSAGDVITGSGRSLNQMKDVAVLSGEVDHDGWIPLPAGFEEHQCKWMVSIRNSNPTSFQWDVHESTNAVHYRTECHTIGRKVHCATHIFDDNQNTYRALKAKANYIIIGVK